MNFWDAIAKVLSDEGGPLHTNVITERLLGQGLWHSEGKTPAATVAARLYTDIKKKGTGSRFIHAGKNPSALNPETASATATEGVTEAPPAPATGSPTTSVVPAAGAPLKKRLSFTDAAEDVLKRHGTAQPMHYRDITKKVLGEDLVKTSGKTPEATLYAQV